VCAKFTAYDNELKKLDDGIAAIQKAHTVKDFSDGINLIVSSEFSASPAATAASMVQSLNADEQTTLRILLGATNASTWAFVGKAHPGGFVPEVVMPAERQIFQQLNDDPAVSANHQHYRLWLDSEGNNTVDWITVGTFDASTGWKQIKAWTPSASATSASFEDRDYGYFDGQYKMTPTQPIFRLEQIGALDEASAFHSIGLEKVWSGDAYSKPLLEVLDSIKDSREGSPLFRAYLFLRLMDLINLQPDAWGLTFCPAVQTHEAQIKSILDQQLSSGDWFVPSKVNAYSNKLEQLFTSTKSVSYAKQSSGLLTLARTVSQSGLQYVGFVGLDGKPNFVDNSTTGEVFGYSANRKQPVLLATKAETGQSFKEQAMPLSPLFALISPCKEYLTQAGVNPSDDSFRGALPPLFQESVQP
jgi:hypothetical protein